MKRLSRFFLLGLIPVLLAAALAAETVRLQAQEGLSRFLGVPVHVRRLTFSARRLTLHRVSFEPPSSSPITVERLQMEGSILSGFLRNIRSVKLTGFTLSVGGVPLQAEGQVFLSGKPGSYARAEGWLKIEHPMLRGSIEVTGPLLRPVVYGWFEEGLRGNRRNFLAQMEISRRRIKLSRLEVQGGWTAFGSLALRRPSWKGELNVTGPDGRFGLEVEPTVAGAVRAVLWARHHRDSAPRQFSAEWVAHRDRLEFCLGLLNRQAVLEGQVALQLPYASAMTLTLDNLNLGELRGWIPGDSDSGLSGRVQGSVSVGGLLSHLASSGELITGKGRFGRMDFDQISIRFKGNGTVLRLENSQLQRAGSTLLMDGTVDLKRIGRPDFFRLVKLSPAEGERRALSAQDLQIALSPEQNLDLRLGKDDRIIAVEHRKKF